jgi:tetratricopeptide (TPR) repeat protein
MTQARLPTQGIRPNSVLYRWASDPLPGQSPGARLSLAWNDAAPSGDVAVVGEVASVVYGPRIGVWSASIVALALVGLLATAGWAVEAPRLSQPPLATNQAGSTPGATHALVRLADRLDALPIVVRDLPDAPSQKAAAEYAALRVTDEHPAVAMFTDAWAALDVPAASAQQVNSFSHQLLLAGRFSLYGPRVPDDQTIFDGATGPIIGELTSDPRNGDRFSNAAIALFAIGVARNNSPLTPAGQADMVRRARLLLALTADRFPASRPAHLNLAFVTSVNGARCGNTGGFELLEALKIAAAWLQSHPADITARMLVGSLDSRRIQAVAAGTPTDNPRQTVGLGDALSALDPLLSSPATSALGNAAIGDAYQAAAMAVEPETPWLARHDAQQALQAYDRALLTELDPGLLAGEAAALSLLGQRAGALAAQRRAVALAPGRPELLLGLALDQEASGDFHGMQATAEQALTLAASQSNRPLRDARLIMQAPSLGRSSLMHGDLGFLGYSAGSDRPRVNVTDSSYQCGGGGYVLSSNVIPQLDDPRIEDPVRWDLLPAAALTLALAASTILAEPARATADLGLWRQLLAGSPAGSINEIWAGVAEVMAAKADAPALVSGQLDIHRLIGQTASYYGSADRVAVQFGEGWLRHAASRSRQTQLFHRAAVLCGGAAMADPDLHDDAERCAAESSFHAGDRRAAAATLADLFRTDQSNLSYLTAQIGLEAGFAAWQAGDTNQAVPLLQQATAPNDVLGPADAEVQAAGHELLGEMLLDQGQLGAATVHLQEAVRLATRDATDLLQAPQGYVGVGFLAADRTIVHDASNDQGLALVSSLQSKPEAAPDCARQRATCDTARSDFAQALAVDPYDPVALQNIGWVDRLEGHLGAARAELSRAVLSNPGQYPALNDLGWLAATSGDPGSARSALERALVIAPDDDLAAWNLGVLSLASGPLGLLSGEAYLARAIRGNPDLREQPLAYRTDERIYRQTYGTTIEPVSTRWLDTRFGGGVVATGALGATSALLSFSGLDVEEQLTELLSERQLPLVGGLLARIRRRRQDRPPHRAWRFARSAAGWLVTIGALTGVAAWTAWPASTTARSSLVVLALLATAMALLVHESAHVVAACLAGIRLRPVWPGRSTLVSVALMSFGISDGPFPGHQADPATAFRKARWVYLAGPLANLAAAAAFYALFRFEPLPVLRLLAEVQLGAGAFSVLPIRPLDASAFQRHRVDALLLIPIALLAAVGGYAFRVGLV